MFFIFLMFCNVNTVFWAQEEWYKLNNKENVEIPQPKVYLSSSSFLNFEDFFKKIGNLFGREDYVGVTEHYFKSSFREDGKEIIFDKDLKPIKDKHLYEGIVFKSSSGNPIYLSLSRSKNCPGNLAQCDLSDKILMVFIGENKYSFVRVKDVVNVSFFMSGSKTVEFYGEKYTVKIKANLSDVERSIVEVVSQKGDKVVNKTLSELKDYINRSGYDLIIESKKYKVLYGRSIDCLPNDGCVFSSDKNGNVCFIVEYPIKEDSAFLSIYEDVWGGKDIYFNSIGRNYLFNLKDGILKIRKR